MAWHHLIGTLIQSGFSQQRADGSDHLWLYVAYCHQRAASSGPGLREAEDKGAKLTALTAPDGG